MRIYLSEIGFALAAARKVHFLWSNEFAWLKLVSELRSRVLDMAVATYQFLDWLGFVVAQLLTQVSGKNELGGTCNFISAEKLPSKLHLARLSVTIISVSFDGVTKACLQAEVSQSFLIVLSSRGSLD
jgi:hypothetical protein